MNLGNIFNNAQQNANRKTGEALEQYGVDLTKLAKENKLDPVIGRHEEIRRTLQILGKFVFCSRDVECKYSIVIDSPHTVIKKYASYNIARRTKNNPVLIGEPGVGKTAIGK